MKTEEEKAQEIRQAYFEYAKENEHSAFDTSGYFARRFARRIFFDLYKSLVVNLYSIDVI